MILEIIFNVSSYIVVSILFASILIANEICYRLGKRHHSKADEELKRQTNGIQAGILGLLAFLLGFTFHMSVERFDERSEMVVHEANAIEGALLKTKLLTPPYDSITYALLIKYLDLRIQISSVELPKTEERAALDAETDKIKNQLWDSSAKAANTDPRPVIAAHFITSVSELIDARAKRTEIQHRHVPEPVLIVLFLVFIMGGGFMGYTSGLGNRRAYFPVLIFNLVIVLVMVLILDMDHPKRGLVKVDQKSLHELKHEFGE